MKKSARIYLTIITLLLFKVCSAAEVADLVRFDFNRGLDFYKWSINNRNHFTTFGEKFHSETDFYVMLRQPPGFPNQWKTSLDFNAGWSKALNREFEITGDVNSNFFRDRQVSQSPPYLLSPLYPGDFSYNPNPGGLTTGLENQIYRQSAAVGLAINSFSDVNLKPSAGIYGERILESTAVGPLADLQMDWKEMEIGGFQTQLDVSGNGKFMSGRIHREVEVDFIAAREYSENTANEFSAQYRTYSREFPVSTAENDRRQEDEYSFSNNLTYNIIEPINFNLNLEIARRKVEPTIFDNTNRLEEISTALYAGFAGELEGHSFNFGFSSDGQNQTYPVRKVAGRQYRLQGGWNFLMWSDSLKFTGMLSRYKYDVSPEFYSIDTHDELRHSYALTHQHEFEPGLELATTLRTDLYHMVYLKSERSGDNHWERFFLFSPTMRYNSDSWSQRARFLVSAKYIDYDFPSSAASSRVYRKFSAEDSLHIELIGNWAMEAQYLLLLEDQGGLNWGAFVEELSDEYRTHDGSLSLVYRWRNLRYKFGWAYYNRGAYHIDAEGDLQPGEKVESSGPLISLQGEAPYEIQIQLSASYKWITATESAPYTLTTIDLTLFKNL